MIKGSCLCKGYQFEIQGECTTMVDCHCSMCRKAHGSDYANFVGCAGSDFHLLTGEDLVTSYQSSEQGTRSFCRICGSNLPMTGGDEVYVPAGLIEDDPGVRTSMHFFVGSRAPWVTIYDDAPQFDEYPTG